MNVTMTFKTTCPRCNGEGQVDLPEHLFRLLLLLKHRGPQTTKDLIQAVKEREYVTHPAMCNRLAALEELGLIERKRDPEEHRQFIWSLKGAA